MNFKDTRLITYRSRKERARDLFSSELEEEGNMENRHDRHEQPGPSVLAMLNDLAREQK